MINHDTAVRALRQTFLDVLQHGCLLLDEVERHDTDKWSTHDLERAYKRVSAHGFAAQALLGGAPELHGALVEHPDFMRLRVVMRAYNG